MFQIFAKDDPKHPNPSPRWVERRKHPRYQYVREIEICREGIVYTATTFEISESGMSAATPNLFRVGAIVEISPIVGRAVKAIVRRKLGTMYGFEFLGLTDDQRKSFANSASNSPSSKAWPTSKRLSSPELEHLETAAGECLAHAGNR